MKKMVSRAQVLDSGKKLPNLKSFKWNARKYGEQSKTMDGVIFVDTIPDQTFSLDHVVPRDNPVLDHSDVKDKTYIILLTGGKRITFTGVDALEDGEFMVDGEKEGVIPVVYGYDDYVLE